jgi:predicted dehydrogenase
MPISPATVPQSVAALRGEQGPVTTYAIVGNGWRSGVFLRLAYLLPHLFRVTGVVTRRAEAGEQIERDFGVPTYRTVDELLAAERPQFVIASVPWPITPELIRDLVARDMPVLAETPPAPDLDGLRSLWSDVGSRHLVQIAEQYALMPLHAARVTIAREGLIGTPTAVHVSSTHLYHVVSMIRTILGVGRVPATISSATFHAPLVDPTSPAGWNHDETPKDARTIHSTIDFGAGRMGVYDFTDNQWWNPLRPDHLLVRGSAGEIADETVVRMADSETPVTSRLERTLTGQGMNYELLDLNHITLDGRVVFRNEYRGASLMDDDIGVAELLARTGEWVRDSAPEPYPLADGIYDHQVGLAIEGSADAGAPVELSAEPWMQSE